MAKWKYFQDSRYYGLWAVRREDQKGFSQAFHVQTKKEAEYLVKELNKIESLRGIIATLRKRLK